jgi:hypothetical protein
VGLGAALLQRAHSENASRLGSRARPRRADCGLAARRALASWLQSPSSVDQSRRQQRRMKMIRNVMFGVSLLALSGASAFAAPATAHKVHKSSVVAQADTAAPADKTAAPKTDKKEGKKHTKKTPKADAPKADSSKEMKAAPEKAAK